MSAGNIERAEQKRRGRAVVMGLAALILPVNAAMQFGDSAFSTAGGRAASWLVLTILWLIILATGGAIFGRGQMKMLINDELSLQNRSRAISAGFYATIAAAMLIYLVGWRTEISAQDALRVVTAIGLATALGRYAWLEWN